MYNYNKNIFFFVLSGVVSKQADEMAEKTRSGNGNSEKETGAGRRPG